MGLLRYFGYDQEIKVWSKTFKLQFTLNSQGKTSQKNQQRVFQAIF